jgi:hypothetical protein
MHGMADLDQRIAACALALLGALAAPLACAAPKTDVVMLLNGDRYTGEVKGMQQGQLEFKTDAAGTLFIEWNKIASLKTDQYVQVELENGLRLSGVAPRAGENRMLLLVADEAVPPQEAAFAAIVRLDPIERGKILKRLDGYVTAGYNYTKSNDLQQLTFTGGLGARTEVREWALDGSSTVTSQEGNDDTSRYSIDGWWRRFLRQRWFLQGFGGFESNDELALDLRTMLGGAYGRYLVQTQKQEWAAYAGLAYTLENYQGEERQESTEAVFGTQYSYFRYDSPEASFDAMLNFYPSLTESGRVRSEGKLRSRYEIVDDLFFEVSLYGSYDSDPGAQAESNSDYGLTTSLGYTF